MLSKDEKLKVLEKILSSKGFKTSGTYKKLLTYLVEASVNKVKLKEYSLAIDVFEKGMNFNSSEDSSVRVYVSNLRKKLDHYYATAGRNDKNKIEIPKGHYDLSFVPNILETAAPEQPNWRKSFYILLPITLILLTYFLFTFNKSSRLSEVSNILNNPAWKNLANNSLPKLLVVGNDLFFLKGKKDEQKIVRKHYINTTDEFEFYKQLHPEENITQITPYPFFPLISVSELPILLQKLNFKNDVFLKSSSEIKAKDIKTNDIIFIGSFRNLNFLSYLLEDSLYEYSNNPKNLYLKIREKNNNKVFKQIGAPDKESVDYCLFRKLPGPNNNTIYMFISFFQHGMSAAMNNMLNEKELKKIYETFVEKYESTPEYFDIIFKSSGYSRTAFKTSIEYIHITDPKKLKIW